MKKLWYLSVLVISIFASVIISLFVVVSIHAFDPSEKEEIYGTWINPEYGKEWEPRKIIMYPDGTWKRFRSINDLATEWTGTYTLTGKWTDSDGNIWYKQIWKWKMWNGGERYEINRISNAGKTLELILSEYDFPEGIDADHPNYRIYYHQE